MKTENVVVVIVGVVLSILGAILHFDVKDAVCNKPAASAQVSSQ